MNIIILLHIYIHTHTYTGNRKVFFRRWFEVVDLLVIVISTILTIVFVLLSDEDTLLSGGEIAVK